MANNDVAYVGIETGRRSMMFTIQRANDFTSKLKTMVDNHREREKSELRISFNTGSSGYYIPDAVIDCYGDAAYAERKIFKLSQQQGFRCITTFVEEKEHGKLSAVVNI